jgi:NAD(P)-dependent dehydrogenase (short-subunit alcohol dehydrogenase family)
MMQIMDLNGAVIFITGAGSGIGRALAMRFVDEEPEAVIVTDVDGESADAVSAAIGGTAMVLDVSDESATRDAVETVLARHGRIDLLCLNAGIATPGSVDVADDGWALTWQVNLMAHVHALRHALPSMIGQGGGYVLTTASAAGLLTNIGSAPYSVTKHAAVALSEWVAITYGHLGIKVSCLCPQFVDTPMLDVFDPNDAAMRSFVADLTIQPEDVAEAVVAGLQDERFLILPHEEVINHMRYRVEDRDGWIRAMQGLQAKLDQQPWTGTS